MNVKKLKLGLIGKDVSKSPSGQIHIFILNELGVECEYEKMSVKADEFDNAMRHLLGDFDAFSITIPYKRDVFEYLDGIEGEAFDCGAVNTVINATRRGYNTDGAGFMLMLAWAGIKVAGKRVLVLGAGGSGRSLAVSLKKAGANVSMYRRNKSELDEVFSVFVHPPTVSYRLYIGFGHIVLDNDKRIIHRAIYTYTALLFVNTNPITAFIEFVY